MKKETKEKIMQVVEDFCRREIREQPIRSISYDDSKARMAKLLATEEIEERDAGRIVGAYFYHYAEHRESTHEDIFAAVKEEIAKILDEYDDDDDDDKNDNSSPNKEKPETTENKETNKTSGAPQSANGKQEPQKNSKSSPTREQSAEQKSNESSPVKEPTPPNNTNLPNAQTKNDKISLTKEEKSSPNKEKQKTESNTNQNDQSSTNKEQSTEQKTEESSPESKVQDNPSPNKEENKSPNSPAKEKPRGTARQRAIQNLLSKKTEEALSVSITKEEKEEGDKTLKKVIDDLLTQWTILDTLIDHKNDIKLLRERGHSDTTICQKFQEAYPKFGTIPIEYIEIALSRKSQKRK